MPNRLPHLLSLLALTFLLGLMAVPAMAAPEKEGLLGPPPDGATRDVDPATQQKIDRLAKRTPLESKNYHDQYELANLYYDAGFYDLAEKRYLRVLEINDKYVPALVNLGSLYEDLNRMDDAIDKYEAALSVEPNDCKARSNLGNAYYTQARYPDAMYEYEQAVKDDPKCYQAYFNMGVAFADAGIFREAVKYWRKVVDLAPGTEAARQAQENIGLLHDFTSGPVPAPREVPDQN